MERVIPLFVFLLLSCYANARVYHVDGQNASSGDGSEENPFQTIAQAANIMVAGDTCYIHAGTYRESIRPVNSGRSSKPITFTCYQDDIVIISATEVVSGWQPYTDKIYKRSNVTLPLGKANNVYFQEQKMQLARWPNDTDGDEYTLDAKYIDKTKGTYSKAFISNQEIPDVDWTGGIIHYLGAHSGCSWERTITKYEPDVHRVHFATLPEKWPFNPHNPYRLENGHRGLFYLMNKLEALDAPGEWYYDDRNRTLYFYAPTSLEDGSVEVAIRSHTGYIAQNHIHFDRLNFWGGMISINGSHNRITRCMVKHGTEKLITDIKGATLKDAAIQVLGGRSNLIEQCVLENGTLNGLYLGKEASYSRVENCIIQNFNTIGIHAYLIGSHGKRNVILKNSLYGSARDGVKVTGDHSEFGYNHVQKCLISGADGGLFYVTGNSVPRHIEVHHNWFHDAYADVHAGKKATGIYLDNNAAGYLVHHNVVWDVEWAGLHFNWNALKNEIYHNTFWEVGKPEEAVISSWVPVRNGKRLNVRDNVLYNNFSDVRPWWESGDGKRYRVDEEEYSGPNADNEFQYNEQFSSPPFVSLADKNFMPREGSPVVDRGKVIRGISDDYTGTAPDLGAYEYGTEYWIPGVDWKPTHVAWTPSAGYLDLD